MLGCLCPSRTILAVPLYEVAAPWAGAGPPRTILAGLAVHIKWKLAVHIKWKLAVHIKC